nr:hypothetical protein Iba_chr12aCG10980 [Ipomoea batatas]
MDDLHFIYKMDTNVERWKNNFIFVRPADCSFNFSTSWPRAYYKLDKPSLPTVICNHQLLTDKPTTQCSPPPSSQDNMAANRDVLGAISKTTPRPSMRAVGLVTRASPTAVIAEARKKATKAKKKKGRLRRKGPRRSRRRRQNGQSRCLTARRHADPMKCNTSPSS